MTRKEDLKRILENFERTAASEYGMAKSCAVDYVHSQADKDRNASLLHDALGKMCKAAADQIRGNIESTFDGERDTHA
jgi:hypothetical protein